MAFSAATAVAAVVGTGYGIYQGEEGKRKAKQAGRRQEQAQTEAKTAAASQKRKAEEAQNRANRQTPDIGAILAGAEQDRISGGPSTLLTGAMGVDPTKLNLSKKTLLGG